MSKKEFTSNLEFKFGVEGFSRSFLEVRALDCYKKDIKTFNAALALLIYGIVLFPNIDNFVYITTIGVFLTKNVIPAL